MNKLLASLVKGSPEYNALAGDRFFAANSLGVGGLPEIPKKPFAVFREEDALSIPVAKDTAPNVCRRVLRIYVHDEKGGYTRINQILDVLRETVRGLTSQVSVTGARCLEAEWNGNSADLEDPVYKTNMKFATFTLVSTQ